MPQDFAKARPRAATHSRPPSRVPAWVWLFTGSVLGAFTVFLLRLSEVPSGDTASEREAGTHTATQPAEPPVEQEKPRFDFYKLLKESKVPLPAAEQDETAATPAAKLDEYVLQVASFKTAADAEQLRAELILLNLDAHVEMAKVRNGETWHRVMVGPFESRSKLSRARNILVSNRFDVLVLKRSIEG